MLETLTIALLSALIVSTVSFVGAATFLFKGDRLKKVTNLLLALAAGAMLGNALLHLLPHALEQAEHSAPPAIVQTNGQRLDHADPVHADERDQSTPSQVHDDDRKHDHHAEDHDHGEQARGSEAHDHHGLSIIVVLLIGFFSLFALDLSLLSLGRNDSEGVKPLGYLVLFSDGLENFLDGLVIGAAYLVSIPAGIAATVAIFLHEVPMELGDFAVLTHSGFSKRKALFFNFLSACVNLVGVSVAVVLGGTISGFATYATPFAAGAILYLAASGLLPQLRTHGNAKEKCAYFAMTLLGVFMMALILLLE